VKIRAIRVSNSVASDRGSAILARMPIYEFHCEACNKDSEVLVRSSDWKGTLCPKCGSTRLEKKFSTFAASVAGGGAADLAGSCSGVPSSCGMCGTGKPHSH
jgi:putative FmdB family regulatory protein